RLGDVLGLEALDALEPATGALPDLRTHVRAELGGDGARLDDAHPNVALGHLLAQRVGERADAVLGQVVDAGSEPGGPSGDGGDVDEVGAAAGRVVCRGQ